ncbi:hypothetical protein Gotur_029415 [Gossypium turneri]
MNVSTAEEDRNGDDEGKTPTFIKGNRFFGISLADSSSTSPRWTKILRKLLQEKVEFVSKYGDGQVPTEAEGDILLHLKRQVHMDRKSLMSLYMELDEERNTSVVVAYNAMAMITRLQADEAAVQMEALQYQRMMEEQVEYDQEILQEMNNLLVKREEEIKELDELEIYRHNYGCLKAADFEGQGGDGSDEGYQVLKPPSYSSTNGSPTARRLNEMRGECTSPTARKLNEWRAECTSPTARKLNELRAKCTGPTARKLNELRVECTSPTAHDGGGDAIKRPIKVSKGSRQLSRLKNLDKKPHISSAGGRLTSRSSNDEEETGVASQQGSLRQEPGVKPGTEKFQFTPILMSYKELYQNLFDAHVVSPSYSKPPQPPYPKWFQNINDMSDAVIDSESPFELIKDGRTRWKTDPTLQRINGIHDVGHEGRGVDLAKRF